MINSYRTFACALLGILLALGGLWHSDFLMGVIIAFMLPWPYIARETISALEDLYVYIVWKRKEKELQRELGVLSSKQRG